MEQAKFRHELKYEINLCDYFTLRQRLRGVLTPDGHSGPDGSYLVRSLYFDNQDDKALREKLDGVSNREKFRIRFYNFDFSYIVLEKKSKARGLCSKQSVRLAQEQCGRILSGDIDWMKDSGAPVLTELYTKMRSQQLRPKTLVDYSREAFIYTPGNVRITLDGSIRTGMYATDLFCKDLGTLSACRGSTYVLEVKYDAFLPEVVRDLIQTGCRQASSFSKYARCRVYG